MQVLFYGKELLSSRRMEVRKKAMREKRKIIVKPSKRRQLQKLEKQFQEKKEKRNTRAYNKISPQRQEHPLKGGTLTIQIAPIT